VSAAEKDRAEVSQALDRLLAWPEMARSPQLGNFLTYIVGKRVAGDTQSIKAYSIAVDVFGRPSDFDPQADPIVRVQARRLRALLDQYYRGPGAADPLQIQLPIGRYVPEFVVPSASAPDAAVDGGPINPGEKVPPAPVPGSRRRGQVTLPWFGLLLLTIAATVLAYSVATLGPQRDQQPAVVGALQMPRLKVMEFQNLTGDTMLTPSIAALAVELVTDFAPLLIVDVSFGGRGSVPAAPERPDDFVLTGVVREDGGDGLAYQFNAILTEIASDTVVWDWSALVPRSQLTGPVGVDAVSQELIMRMGGPRGPLHARAREFLARTDITGQENGYLCAILFSLYRTSPTPAVTSRTEACLAALGETAQANGNVIAARASLFAEAPVAAGWNSAEQLERYLEAEAMLDAALRAAPTSSFVWEQQARLQEAIGQHDDAESAYSTSLQLNTANIDGTAAHARHLALTGHLDLAIALSEKALISVPAAEAPDWFQCVPAMAALRDQAFQRAQRLALQCGRADREIGPMITLLAAGRAGDAAALGQALPLILDVSSFRISGVMTRLERRITDTALLSQIEDALRKAGVPEKSLVSAF